MLEEQRIGPELSMHNFDNYLDLMNGKSIDEIESFIKREPEFEEYCALIEQYKSIEHAIARECCGVVTIGFYEFHREGLVDTLESLARFMQQQLVAKVTADEQKAMSILTVEYEEISTKLLSTPRDTKALMELKAYAAKTEEETIPEMEDRLRVVIFFSFVVIVELIFN